MLFGIYHNSKHSDDKKEYNECIDYLFGRRGKRWIGGRGRASLFHQIAESEPAAPEFTPFPVGPGKVHRGRNVSVFRRTPGATPAKRRFLPRPVTTHGESQFLRHLRTEALMIRLGVFLGIPAELENGHDDGQGKTAE